MATKRVESSKGRLRDQMNEGRKYLDGEKHEESELLRLKNKLEKKKAQFKKDFAVLENDPELDDEKKEEYEAVNIDAEDLMDDYEHYLKVEQQKKKEQEAVRIAEEKRQEREMQLEEKNQEREMQLEEKRLEQEIEKRRLEQVSEDRQYQLEMKKLELEEKIKIEQLHVEKMKVTTEEKIATIKEREKMTVKLPKLEMKKFDGDILKWTEFWDSYESTIHNNKSLHDVDKFNYLKNQLQGTASETLSGLELTKDNYHVAVDLLKERYGKRQFMINAHYAKMMNMPIATYRTASLRSFYDTTEKHLRCLRTLGENDNQMQVLSMLQSKLPRSVLLNLERMKPVDEEWDVKKFRKLLSAHITNQEACDLQMKLFHRHDDAPHKSTGPRYNQDGTNNTNSRNFTAETLLSNENVKQKYGKTCIFCKNNHWSDECQKYPDIPSRKKMLKDRCLRCMKENHQVKDCKVTGKICFHCGEKDKHHRTLCPKKFNEKEDQNKTATKTTPENGMVAIGEKVVMQTALVNIKGEQNTTATTRILFDTGSTRTYITKEMMNILKLKPLEEQTFSIYSFGNSKPKQKTSPIVEIAIRPKKGHGKDIKIRATVTERIAGPLQRTPLKLTNKQNLKKYDLADTLPSHLETYTLGLLIGNDHYYDIIQEERKKIEENLYIVKSKLGWIISGKTSEKRINENENTFFTIATSSQLPNKIHRMEEEGQSTIIKPSVEDLWNLESIGIKQTSKDEKDDLAMDIFKNTISKEDQRYYVSWPWREENQDLLPENYELSVGRLRSLVKRFEKDPDLLQRYDETIRQQLDKDVIEIVDSSQVNNNNKKHYVPHHAVVTPDKVTTKLRIVYDASAKTKKGNKSLNECLYRGPVILDDLCGLMLRFRTKKIGIVADIEKAFLQVGLHEADRDVTRFLWLKDIKKPVSNDNLVTYRFKRLPFGVISSPFLLGATIQHHLHETNTTNATKIKNNMYVDNVVNGAETEEEAVQFYKEGKKIFKDASMNLREWTTNSPIVNDQIQQEDRVEEAVIKVLGLNWNTRTDQLSIPTKKFESQKVATTKREVLSTIASIYDPLGMLTPCTIKMKIFLQELWEKDLDWDDPLDDKDVTEWRLLTQDLQQLSTVQIPRFVGGGTYQLLCFCDSSKKAYASAIYLRIIQDGKVNVHLVFSKSRNAPKKKLTIPKLELMSVLIGTRSLAFVEKELSLANAEKILWTDSQCVLKWLQQKENTNVFVRNRIKEISEHDNIVFRYINTRHNPADIPTRGIKISELKNCSLWWNGPDWLLKNKNDWPTWNVEECDPKDKNDEEPQQQVIFEMSGAQPEIENERTSPFGLDETRYSTLKKLLRVTAYMNRFIKITRKKQHMPKELTADEINEAEVLWIKYIQMKNFMTKDDQLDEEQKKSNLNPEIQRDGIIRLRGRMINANLPDETKTPILLPRKEYFTRLLVAKIHKDLCHGGAAHTLAQLRQKYWIPRGRTEINSVIRKCLKCIRHQGGPYKAKPMSPWPRSKVNISAPFTKIGVDYFGPLYIKDGKNHKKVWVCLFTCIVTRAVHLELVEDMTTELFLEALRRFIARRGKPDEITSDNATQFKAAKETIHLAWNNVINDPQVHSYFSEKGIKWNFIVELSPWMGGFYERLVGTTKSALKKSIGRLHLSRTQLQTIITEVEGVVNSRPLVYVDNDLENHIITPMHFLSLNPKVGTPPSISKEEEEDPDYKNEEPTTSQRLLDIWKKGNKHLEQFWKIWKDNYLLSLRERSQKFMKHQRIQSKQEPKVGDVVQIKEDAARGAWKIGRIIEMIRSNDGLERAARILTPNRNILQRSIVHLYPLECNDEEKEDEVKGSNDVIDEDELENNKREEITNEIRTQHRQRPVRKVAQEARDRIFGQNLEE